MRLIFLLILALVSVPVPAAAGESRAPLVLAAASLQESLNAAADAWAAKKRPRPVLSFAASSALARQVEAGAPADIFASADKEWMDYLETRGLLKAGSRAVLVENRLVLIAPMASKARLKIGQAFPLARALGDGRLAMADPEAVPAGRYGKAALTSLGVWAAIADKVVRAENVRAALALVERGEAPFGIVYATDARASGKVRVISTFPENAHPPIVYPIALLRDAKASDAEAFRRFLTSRGGKAIFRRFGFEVP